MPQRLGSRIGKSQTGGTLASFDNGAVDGQDGVFGENTVVTDTLDLEQATVGRKADLAQLREILQALADSKIVGVVDCGLGAQRAIFFVILLDACVFVVDVQRGGDILSDDAGVEPARRAVCHSAIEDQLDLVWPSKCSKNRRPWTGRSSTWVRENSACKMEIS
jgi:hypothetical protein